MGHPAIEKGWSGHNLPSVTTAVLTTIKTYNLLPNFLAGFKTNWPVDTYLLRIIQVATKRSELFACAELTELTPPPIRMDWSLTLKDKI
jgi:hypothetical protein